MAAANFPVLVFAQNAPQNLPQPTITVNPDIYYPFDEILYLEGVAKPASTVEIRFFKNGAKPVKFNVKSDANGEWVLAEKVPLEAGDWEVRARIVQGQNAASDWSNPRVFKVIVNGITLGGVNIKFAFLTFLILMLFAFAAASFWYFRVRLKGLQNLLFSKEVREAKESVRAGFAELRRDLTEELRILQSKKELTSEEESRKEHLLRELDTLERGMEKEIEDIEKKI